MLSIKPKVTKQNREGRGGGIARVMEKETNIGSTIDEFMNKSTTSAITRP